MSYYTQYFHHLVLAKRFPIEILYNTSIKIHLSENSAYDFREFYETSFEICCSIPIYSFTLFHILFSSIQCKEFGLNILLGRF